VADRLNRSGRRYLEGTTGDAAEDGPAWVRRDLGVTGAISGQGELVATERGDV
jgi:hypothetical protein